MRAIGWAHLIAAAAIVALVAPTADAQDFKAAGKHFDAAEAAFAKHDYLKAADEYQSAYDITKDPSLLFNMGDSYDKAGKPHLAIKAYERYLKENPTASDKSDVEKKIATLKKQHGAPPEEVKPPVVVTPPLPPAAPDREHRILAEMAMEKRDFGRAATEYEAAFNASKDPLYLKKLADAREKAGDGAGAVKALTQYEAASPSAPDRFDVDMQIASLKRVYHLDDVHSTVTPPTSPATTPGLMTPGEMNTTVPPVATTPPAGTGEAIAAPPPAGLLDEDHPSSLKLVAWVGVATTVALVTAGAIFGLASQSRSDEISRLQIAVDMNTGRPPVYDAATAAKYNDLRDTGQTYNTVAIGMLAGAGAVAVVSAVLFYVDYRGKASSESHVVLAPSLGTHTAGLSAGWSF